MVQQGEHVQSLLADEEKAVFLPELCSHNLKNAYVTQFQLHGVSRLEQVKTSLPCLNKNVYTDGHICVHKLHLMVHLLLTYNAMIGPIPQLSVNGSHCH